MPPPHTKKRDRAKEKAKVLTPAQKDENRFAASERVYKAWRIVRDEFR